MARVKQEQKNSTTAKQEPKVANGTTVSKRDVKVGSLAKIVTRSKAFRHAADIFTEVRGVPTIFAQYDHANKLGGHPLQRIAVVHGKSSHGKSSFVLGLGVSFIQRRHFFVYIDAERTTPMKWLRTLMGEYADSPYFLGMHPKSYEETADAVREFLTEINEKRASGELPADTAVLFAVDSLRKLVPKNYLAKMLQGAEKHGLDGFSGRGAQMKAALNSAWLDELVPLLHQSNASMIFIARESEDVNADANDRKYGNDYKITGGTAIIYDSSLVMRIERAAWIYGPGPEGEAKPVYGERHKIVISKSKIGGKEGKKQEAYFHTSNGVLVPEGFDRARDLLELGKRFGVVTVGGSWYAFLDKKFQGENATVKALHEEQWLMDALEDTVRAKFAEHAPIEIDEESET